MSKFENDKVMPRYMVIAIVLTLIGFAVIGKALYTGALDLAEVIERYKD